MKFPSLWLGEVGEGGWILAFNLLTFFKVVRSSHGCEKLTVKQYCFSNTF